VVQIEMSSPKMQQAMSKSEAPLIQFVKTMLKYDHEDMGYQTYPLVMTNIAIENGPFIVDLPSYNMVDLSIVVCMFTRG